jgi:hypothetical protein
MKTIGWILVALAFNVAILGGAGASENYDSSDYKWIGDYVVHRDDNNFDSQTPWEEQFVTSSWGDPVCLLSYGIVRRPSISISGDTLFLTNYQDSLGDNIKLVKSLDGGFTWSEVINLPSPNSKIPRVFQRGSEVWIVARNSQRLKWYKSDDLGESWSIIDTLFYHDASQGYCIAGTSEELYLIYYLYNSERQLILTHWIDSTQNWAESTEITRLTFWTPQPIYFIAQDNNLYILCNDEPIRFSEDQFFIKSTDGGLTWSERAYISDIDDYHSQFGAMAIDGQQIFVTWFDYKYGSHGGFNGDILGRLSTDGGETWGGEIRLTYNQKADESSPVVYGNRLNVMWHDLRYRNYPDHLNEISHSFSYDDGSTWSPVEMITPHPGPAYYPTPGVDWESGGIHFFYKEFIDGADHMFYMYGSNFTGIEDEKTPNLPESPAILTNYPNPFNESTTIKYQLSNNSDVRLSIYNLLGEKITDLVDERQPAGEHEIAWDASEYSSGIYLYKLTAGDKVFTKRMTLLK